ncbi:MAG: hypothetical protein K1X64_20670 [Myxococcaceae bacterium]|nr:hypothetical protein [Myxococcaceae bacterium]
MALLIGGKSRWFALTRPKTAPAKPHIVRKTTAGSEPIDAQGKLKKLTERFLENDAVALVNYVKEVGKTHPEASFGLQELGAGKALMLTPSGLKIGTQWEFNNPHPDGSKVTAEPLKRFWRGANGALAKLNFEQLNERIAHGNALINAAKSQGGYVPPEFGQGLLSYLKKGDGAVLESPRSWWTMGKGGD